MPFVAVPNTIKASFFSTLDGELVMNRVHVQVGGAPTEGDCQTVADICGAWWFANVQPIIGAGDALRLIECKSLHVENGPQAVFVAGLPAVGDINLDTLPNNVAFVISLRTGLTGRSARGRWFWHGITEDQATASHMDATPGAAIVAAMTALRTAIVAASAQLVIVSYVNNGAPRVGGPITFPVTSLISTDNFLDSQRRRLPGRGT
jgi:hypothetical protein